jgi:energy-coupling factor transport system permease protein
MDDLELQRNITIGQYLPTGSFLHHLDPRVKIVGLGLLILCTAVAPSFSAALASLLVGVLLVKLAKVSVRFALNGLRPALPFLLILAVLQLFFSWGVPLPQNGIACHIFWSWGIFALSDCSILLVLTMLARLTAIILLTSLMTMTSTISELTNGTEALLRIFQRFGLPAHELALVFTLALRFVPTLAEELEKLLKAQASRGADIRLGNNPIQRTRQFLPVLVPLFLTTLQRADELSDAMTARGYSGGEGRSHYTYLSWTARDGIVLVALITWAAFLFLPAFLWVDSSFRSLLCLIINIQ